MTTVHLPTRITNMITTRLSGIEKMLLTTPKPGHFAETNDAALRWYRAQLQARLNELAWILKILGINTPPIKPLQK
ncbi:hypothetical protein [Haliscomenobacter sp.]|uniref:hypothetical protein n=1 Tax=Haliscomenobacter sp. TaxID=2717303 RepID=UPI003BAD09A4